MYKSLFGRAGGYEERLNKDIAFFNTDECTGLLASLYPKSAGHVSSLISQFSKYGGWAVKTKMTKRNHWVLVPVDEDYVKYSFTNRYVKDLDELSGIVETCLTVPYDKFVVYLLHMGIMGEAFMELAQIKDDDVSAIEGTIKTIRRTYNEIPKPLLQAMIRKNYYEEKKKRDYESEYFVKPYKTKKLLGQPISYQHVHKVIQKLNYNYNEVSSDAKEFTPSTIWRSGLFYSLYKIEQLKGDIVPDDFLHVSEVYGNKNSYSSYSMDYELYKGIFWGSDAVLMPPSNTHQ